MDEENKNFEEYNFTPKNQSAENSAVKLSNEYPDAERKPMKSPPAMFTNKREIENSKLSVRNISIDSTTPALKKGFPV